VPKNALDNPLVLPILGLLVEQPRHAYAVFAELRHRYEYLDVRNATVYTLLGTLTEAGWIATDASGRQAELRTTRTGAAALADRVATQLRETDLTGGPAFMTALAYLGILPRDRAVAVLRERIDRIRTQRQLLAEAIRSADLPEVHMMEIHYLTARLSHDARWLTRTASRVEAGDLDWPSSAGTPGPSR
jgi:DNA-binding PadR family transcriptional regulator